MFKALEKLRVFHLARNFRFDLRSPQTKAKKKLNCKTKVLNQNRQEAEKQQKSERKCDYTLRYLAEKPRVVDKVSSCEDKRNFLEDCDSKFNFCARVLSLHAIFFSILRQNFVTKTRIESKNKRK